MSVKELSKDQVNEISMIELATIILEEEREAIDFNEIFHRIAKLKGFTEAEKEQYIAQFYTDMNIDGGFMTIGTNRWGLKKWYPVEQMEEEIANLPQKRKKKRKSLPSFWKTNWVYLSIITTKKMTWKKMWNLPMKI